MLPPEPMTVRELVASLVPPCHLEGELTGGPGRSRPRLKGGKEPQGGEPQEGRVTQPTPAPLGPWQVPRASAVSWLPVKGP